MLLRLCDQLWIKVYFKKFIARIFPEYTIGGLVELAPKRSGLEDTLSGISSASESGTPISGAPAPLKNTQKAQGRPTFIALPERDSFFAAGVANPSMPPSPGVHRALTQPSLSPDPSLHLENPLHALVVDDDFITRQLMSRLLTRLGVSVTCAENGAVALDLILGTENSAATSSPSSPNDARTSSNSPDVKLAPPSSSGPLHAHPFDVVFLDNQMVS